MAIEGYSDPPSMTALHLASFNGHEREADFLLSIGGKDIDSSDNFGTNPITSASRNVYDKIVQLLLKKGAEVNAQSGGYGNAFQAASSEGHDKIVQLLLEKGAEANAQGGEYGNSPQSSTVEE